jgi:hypothetical protein
MDSLARRIGRLETETTERWDLTQLLTWTERPHGESPRGSLVDVLQALPVINLPTERQC